ncbi:MAG: trimethylamine methyltransferase family protein [Deltaproteobacteria bacterium]|nr:trimethylamine methyltransferase family protein [Deltaproteobacteria bacterium]
MPATLALGGVDIMYGAGRLGGSTCASPIQMIIDDDLTVVTKRMIAGVKIDEDRLALNQILEAGAGGNYLTMDHTRRYCRETARPELCRQIGLDNWQDGGKKNYFDRAVEKYRRIQKELKPQDLPDDVVKEMNSIVRKADKALCA